VNKDSHRGFDSMVVLVAWPLWREGNERVFNGTCKLTHQLAQHVADVRLQWNVAAFSTLSDMLL
jgi:hypothetical protein